MNTHNKILYARKCSECSKGMNDGYVIDDGSSYYCSEECLHKHYTADEWADLYSDDGSNYWTEWEDENDYEFVEITGVLHELDNELIKRNE